MSQKFLIVRGQDLVVLGVQWSQFELEQEGGRPHLVATGNNAPVVVTFPPQAIAEERITGDLSRRRARLGGPSRIEFRVAAGTSMELTAEGILGALIDASVSTAGGDLQPTAIELPWHLFVSVRSRTDAGVVSDHTARALASPKGALGLWHARLRSRAGTAKAADLVLEPLRSSADDPDPNLVTGPLSAGHRDTIVSERIAADVRRLELSALGGSFSARALSPNFEWDHDATLARDHRVRVLTKGVLYPFGHRAALLELAERIFDPPGNQTVAGIKVTRTLAITEPVRGPVDGNASLARQFPYSEVEIRARSFTGLPEVDPEPYRRTPFPDSDFQQQLNDLTAQRDTIQANVDQILAGQPPDLDTFIARELGSVPQLREAQAAEASVDPDGLIAQQRSIDEAIDALLRSIEPQEGPDGELIPVDPGTAAAAQAEIQNLLAQRPTNQQIQGAIVQRDQLRQQIDQLMATVQQEFNSLPRTVEALAAVGDPTAQELLSLRQSVVDLQGVIDGIAAAAAQLHPLFHIPLAADGTQLQFPLRCVEAGRELCFSTPLIFLIDFSFRAEEHFPEFHSLTDPEVAGRLADAWNRANSPSLKEIPLAGETIDLVRGATRLPGDVHEIHKLHIQAVPHEGTFRPILEKVEAELPALRSLLPEGASRVELQFTQAFRELGASVDVPLAPVDPNTLKIDFTDRPDRAGGLVSPKFTADGISRALGPVAVAALPGDGPPDLSSAYKGATLLGFPLASLIKLDAPGGVPDPPAIVPVIEGGKPTGVSMTWEGLVLKSEGPFKASDATRLTLTVEATRSKSTTTCTVNDFELVLPPTPPDSELLRMSFGSVIFTQRSGQAPNLEVKKLDVQFKGALKLLKALRDELMKKLDIGDGGPTVTAGPKGINVGYGLSVPSVTAGAFLIRNVSMNVAVDVPFERRPVTVAMSFATRENPFNLSVLMFGGGGYIDLEVGPSGLTRLEASLEFGAAVSVDFLVASGEVHALGGVRFTRNADGSVSLDAFIRIGGSVEVLGLVSVSVELLVTLRYEDLTNKLEGRATLVIEIDLTLYSDSVELDSGPWELAGTETFDADQPLEARRLGAAREDAQDAWRSYRGAFA